MNDYIETMRKLIEHETLLTVGCGAIIEDGAGRILLQRRADGDIWGIPGGIMEIGETFEECVNREVIEETNLRITQPLELFGIYSGDNAFALYPNGDKVYSIQIIFKVKKVEGNLQKNGESLDLRFFSRGELPVNLNHHQAPFILDWQEGILTPVVR
jgi:ADP-ribose pyrophosphatase YjhB (NUDIX family)